MRLGVLERVTWVGVRVPMGVLRKHHKRGQISLWEIVHKGAGFGFKASQQRTHPYEVPQLYWGLW